MNIVQDEKLGFFLSHVSDSQERTVTLFGRRNQRFLNYRINDATVVIDSDWCSRVETNLWNGTTLTKPSIAYSTGKAYCIRFDGTDVRSREQHSFVWSWSGHGLPINEIEIIAVGF